VSRWRDLTGWNVRASPAVQLQGDAQRGTLMKVIAWTAGAGLALTLAACGASAPGPQAGPPTQQHASVSGAEGKVVGTFIRVGGPLGQGGVQPPDVPLSGTVQFSSAHRRTLAVRVGKSGQFSLWLPAGQYQAVGSSPSLSEVLSSGATRVSPCSLRVPVTVEAGRPVRITVTCVVP
jgi:hypothetical protein